MQPITTLKEIVGGGGTKAPQWRGQTPQAPLRVLALLCVLCTATILALSHHCSFSISSQWPPINCWEIPRGYVMCTEKLLAASDKIPAPIG